MQATNESIDPEARRVETDAGQFEGNLLVAAQGADLDPGVTLGLVEGGSEFYTVAVAFALHDELVLSPGGRKVIGVTSTPFKHPPAPSKTALQMHAYLATRGLWATSTIFLVMPFVITIPPSSDTLRAIFNAFAECGIEWAPDPMVIGHL